MLELDGHQVAQLADACRKGVSFVLKWLLVLSVYRLIASAVALESMVLQARPVVEAVHHVTWSMLGSSDACRKGVDSVCVCVCRQDLVYLYRLNLVYLCRQDLRAYSSARLILYICTGKSFHRLRLIL